MKVDRYMGLSVNQEEAKCMYVIRNIRDDEDISDLKVDEIFFHQA